MLKHKCAFTLAEVLITLGIIGIVAAMTLPTVINNVQNKQLEAGFKKAYSTLYQAVMLMGNDDPQLWQTYCVKGTDPNLRDNDYTFIKDFSKQFQVLTLQEKNTINLKNIGYKQDYFYAAEKGKNKFNQDSHNNGAFIAKNGMIVLSSGCWWSSLDFIVDTNGHKGPNKLGYDVFYFQIAKNNQLLPSSINSVFGVAAAQEAGCCTLSGEGTGHALCGKEYSQGTWTDNGSACTRFALMDRLPGDSGKSYWKNLPAP